MKLTQTCQDDVIFCLSYVVWSSASVISQILLLNIMDDECEITIISIHLIPWCRTNLLVSEIPIHLKIVKYKSFILMTLIDYNTTLVISPIVGSSEELKMQSIVTIKNIWLLQCDWINENSSKYFMMHSTVLL